MSILEIHQKLINKEISAVELTKEYLNKIEDEDKQIHSFLTITPELALRQAREAQERIDKEKDVPLLCGVPCAVKDNILVEGIRCTAGSRILENYIAPYSATVIERLKKLGVVILGKTNMDEFAMGSSTENSAYGVTKNPIDKTRVPGGSSGGSAAAVASDFCQFALGSDTGGSIRQPASFCGLVGLKPTYGAVSRYGLIAMASSLDQIGPITKTVEDARIVFEAIKGKDPLDSTSVESEVQGSKFEIKNLKIGVPDEYFIKGMEKGVEEAIEKAISKLKQLGVKIRKISLPHTEYSLATYYLIMASEASANLARYDGIRYGNSAISNSQPSTHDPFEIYSKTRGKYFGKEVKRRIILGTFALSAGYYDQFYSKAQKARGLIKKDFDQAFKEVDLILTPTTPTVAFKIGEKINDPVKMYLSDIFTVSANLTGLPALSLPCGKIGRLPVGIQIIGRAFEEEKVFEFSKAFEQL